MLNERDNMDRKTLEAAKTRITRVIKHLENEASEGLKALQFDEARANTLKARGLEMALDTLDEMLKDAKA
jgi:hypothetical protein